MSIHENRTISHADAQAPHHRHLGFAHPGGLATPDTADAGKVRLCGLAPTLTTPPPVSKACIADAIGTLASLTGDAADYAARVIAAAITRELLACGTFTLHGLGSFTLTKTGNHFGSAAHATERAGMTVVFEPDPALLGNL